MIDVYQIVTDRIVKSIEAGAPPYVRVTFAEKPSRDVLDQLRGAGFRWGGGSWTGRRDALPEGVA